MTFRDVVEPVRSIPDVALRLLWFLTLYALGTALVWWLL